MTDLAYAETIGANIAAERKSTGFSSGWLAGQLGINASRMSAIEHGNRLPTVRQLVEISDLLSCPIAALFRGVGVEPVEYATGFDKGWQARTADIEAHLAQQKRGLVEAGGVR